MWIIKFKIALLEKDIDSIDTLLDSVPEFSNREDAEQAMYLIQQGMELVYNLQDDLGKSMRQMKQSINFLGNSMQASGGRINIKH